MSSSARPTLAQIAALCHVSRATVSLALRHSPRISEERRKVILECAASVGYAPDPLLSRLMTHLRTQEPKRSQSSICILGHQPKQSQFVNRIWQAAKAEAKALGYAVDFETLPLEAAARRRLGRSLTHRGTEGLLFLPIHFPLDASSFIPWKQFSVLFAGFSPVKPDMDRVVANWHQSIEMGLWYIKEQGYRRAGFVIDRNTVLVLRQCRRSQFSESLQASNDGFAEIFELPQEPVSPKALLDWFDREQPDCLITSKEEEATLVDDLLRRHKRERPPLFCLNIRPRSRHTGLLQAAELIGKAAILELHQKLLRGERGIPARPWVKSFSCQLRQAAKPRGRKTRNKP